MSGSLKSRVTRGTAVSLAGQGAGQGLRLLGNLILTRLLVPEAFGVMALVNVMMNGLQMLSNVGIQPAIVRHPRGDDPVFLDTAFCMQAIRGLLLWGVAALAAAPLAGFYGEPILAELFPVAALAAVMMGLFSTNLIGLTRRLEIDRAVAIELSGQAAALVVMVVVAWITRSVWALVIGGLVSAATRLLLSHVAIPGERSRFRWDPESAREIFSFGKWIFVGSLFTFLALRLDVPLLGKLLPMAELGVYSIGIILAGILRDVSSRLVQMVLMPALSESHRESRERLAESFERARDLVLPAGLLATLATAGIAPAFFETLYDERYRDAGWIAQLSMIALWFSFLQDTSMRALLAVGDSRSTALSNAVRTFTALGCGLAGFAAGGLPGFMLGLAAGALAGLLVVTVRLAGHGLPTWRADLRYTALGLALAAAIAGLPALVPTGLPHAWATLAVATLVLLPFGLRVVRRVLVLWRER